MCMTPTFVVCISIRVYGMTKTLYQSRTSHLIMVRASLLYCLAICWPIMIHILSDYDHIWVAFAFANDTNIFKI